MDCFTNEAGAVIVDNMISALQEHKDYLSEIDGKIGDGDHGINMNKGFSLCAKRLTGKENLSRAMETLGDILLTEIGGSMGPIYGSFFEGMSEATADAGVIDKKIFGEMLSAGLAGIRELVPTNIGDKTLLDALIPAVDAYRSAVTAGDSFETALDKTAAAAEAGKDATKNMIAKVGRASRLGERSRGVLDAGAASCALIINSLCKTSKNLLGGTN